MAEPLESLKAALAHRYTLERELGRGGMATVYLARDLKHDRLVALKVLRSNFAAVLGVERFLREIKLAARLQHPHILPLFDSGDAGGSLWYTMPFVEGESLRDRLAREGELPVPDAVGVLRDIAGALAYAHRHGVIHRDIKPANVLLSEGGSLVADFGVAKALEAAAERGGSTATGLAIGTPAYMAPEQAIGDPGVDHRADLYAVGVVAYELLTGQPPFTGRTPQGLLAAQATEAPEPVVKRRPSVPPALAMLVMRLLEKHPADRPQSAEEVYRALEVTPPGSSMATIPVPTRSPVRSRWVLAGGLLALAVMLSVAAIIGRGKPVVLDGQLVAVGPFRVSSADSSLTYLREGMVDLLAAKLSGTTEWRSADPRTVLSAWQRAGAGESAVSEQQALALARGFGAGRLVQGEVVGSRQQLVISAAVFEVGPGRPTVRASVEGSVDSLTRLVDLLAAKLLALGTGEAEQSLTSLTSTSLPALRAYLDGQALLRRGHFQAAADKFDLAVQLDSTFALAALAETRAGEWLNRGWLVPSSLLAWRYRDRLSVRDRDHLATFVGPNFPRRSNIREHLAAAERLSQEAPDSPEAWYKLGDILYHFGSLLGIPDATERSRVAFARSLALDSSFAPALEHGPQLAFELNDTAGMQRAADLVLRLDSVSPRAAYHRWYAAVAMGDTARAHSVLRAERSGEKVFPISVSATALSQGMDMEGAGELIGGWRREAVTEETRRAGDELMYAHLLHIGRPHQALAFLESTPAVDRNGLLAFDALFGDGDSSAAAASVTSLARDLGTPLDPTAWLRVLGRYAVGQSGLDQGRTDLARRAITDLTASSAPADSDWAAAPTKGFALLLETQLAARKGSQDAAVLLAQLDSTLSVGDWGDLVVAGNLIAARLHEQRGELAAALAAVRRRAYDLANNPAYVNYFREEGRLAALNGDRAGAARAYRRYLAIRIDPEPRLESQVAQVRAELAAIEHGSMDR